LAGLLCGIPTIIHEHMIDNNIPLYQRLADYLLAGTTTYAISISNAVKEFMVQRRSVPEDRVEVVINGIPLMNLGSQNHSEDERLSVEDWRERLSIPSHHKIVGTVGRLNVVKGHRYFLEAASKVLKQYHETTFVIVGDGELRGSLIEMAEQLDIGDHVRFTGHCDDVTPLYIMMDIMVIASLSEGGPITLFEAMASKCAIVSTNTIGLKDVIGDDGIGFLVNPMNPDALAEKILLLLNDPDLCQAMGKKAQEESREYDIRNTVRKLEACYQMVLGK